MLSDAVFRGQMHQVCTAETPPCPACPALSECGGVGLSQDRFRLKAEVLSCQQVLETIGFSRKGHALGTEVLSASVLRLLAVSASLHRAGSLRKGSVLTALWILVQNVYHQQHSSNGVFPVIVFLFLFEVLEMEARALPTLSKCSVTEPHSQS